MRSMSKYFLPSGGYSSEPRWVSHGVTEPAHGTHTPSCELKSTGLRPTVYHTQTNPRQPVAVLGVLTAWIRAGSHCLTTRLHHGAATGSSAELTLIAPVDASCSYCETHAMPGEGASNCVTPKSLPSIWRMDEKSGLLEIMFACSCAKESHDDGAASHMMIGAARPHSAICSKKVGDDRSLTVPFVPAAEYSLTGWPSLPRTWPAICPPAAQSIRNKRATRSCKGANRRP